MSSAMRDFFAGNPDAPYVVALPLNADRKAHLRRTMLKEADVSLLTVLRTIR